MNAQSQKRQAPAKKQVTLPPGLNTLRVIADENINKLRQIAAERTEPAGETLCTELADALDNLWFMAHNLAADNTGNAASMFEQAARRMVEAAAAAVSKLDELSETCTQYESAKAKAKESDLYNETAMRLSLVIEEALGIFPALTDIKDSINDQHLAIMDEYSKWRLEDHKDVREYIALLASFSRSAQRHRLRTPELDPAQVAQLCNDVTTNLALLKDVIGTVIQDKLAVQTKSLEVLARQLHYRTLLVKLHNTRETLKELDPAMAETVIVGSGLLSQEDYDQWKKLNEGYHFRNIAKARHDLDRTVDDSRSLLGYKPELSPNDQETVADAERYFRLLSEELEAAAPTVAKSAQPEILLRKQKEKPTPAPRKPVRDAPPAVSTADARAEEIYRMLVGIAAHIYCSAQHFTGMTIASGLGVLHTLGRITDEEIAEYKPTIANMVSEKALTVTSPRGTDISSAWRNLPLQPYEWVHIQPTGKHWVYRLGEKHRVAARMLADELLLNEDEVKDARMRYREQNAPEWRR